MTTRGSIAKDPGANGPGLPAAGPPPTPPASSMQPIRKVGQRGALSVGNEPRPPPTLADTDVALTANKKRSHNDDGEESKEAHALTLDSDDTTLVVSTLVHHLWSLPRPTPVPSAVNREEFDELVQGWKVASQSVVTEVLDARSRVYESELPIGRRLLAHWSVEGPMSTFVIFFVWLQTAMGLYYFIHLERDPRREVLGWGLPFAKMAAGVLYPTLAFTLLSSCRRLATFLRQWGWVSKFINWDRSQFFHIFLGCTTLFFALLHALSHLSGTFVRAVGSTSLLLPNFPHPITYRALLSTRAGITGIIALSLLIAIVLTGHHRTRRTNFQVFQYAHLLIWPFIALLLVHGTGQLIQPPVLGYWLIVPMLCVLWDRVPRVVAMFRPVVGVQFEVIEDNTTVIQIPKSSVQWGYKPGQYVLLRVAEVSFGEWHPFTLVGNTTKDGDMVGAVYMRKAGDWTSAVMQRAKKGERMTVTLDGPFGSPSDQLSNYTRVVVIGTGIGVTPYAGWLRDIAPHQSVQFHWIVREQVSFSWFSGLLNQFHLRPGHTQPRTNIRLHTYATGLSPRSTLQYVMRVLLEKHRTINHSTSYITGLECETKYGRPDIPSIFRSMMTGEGEDRVKHEEGKEDDRIGVFFCGPNYLGMEISDRCRMERFSTGVKWEFVGEVF